LLKYEKNLVASGVEFVPVAPKSNTCQSITLSTETLARTVGFAVWGLYTGLQHRILHLHQNMYISPRYGTWA